MASTAKDNSSGSHRKLQTLLTVGSLVIGVSAIALRSRLRRVARVSKPPVAAIKPRTVFIGKVAGENRGPNPMDPPKEITDDYYWMRDDQRKNPEVISYLEAENEYTEHQTRHLQGTVDSLYKEFLSRIKVRRRKRPRKIFEIWEATCSH